LSGCSKSFWQNQEDYKDHQAEHFFQFQMACL
jgi:hypothetical protein